LAFFVLLSDHFCTHTKHSTQFAGATQLPMLPFAKKEPREEC
jgi:hypothetical protein